MVTSVMIFVSEAVCSSRLFTALVGLAEINSEHPLGAAVVNYAKSVSQLLYLLMTTVCTCGTGLIHNETEKSS